MSAWLAEAAERLGVVGVTEDEQTALLELARVAAHDSGDRTNAPLVCFLVGVAHARGVAVAELVDEATRGRPPSAS